MEELLTENDVFREDQEVFQFNQGINVGTTTNNVINLNTFSISIGPSNPLQHLAFVNFSEFDFTTHVKTNRHPTHGTTTTLKSIEVKMKISSIFMSVIEANDKKNKTLVGTMDHINAS
jgi:hypothetical protein